jgi:excisionase family DNA binding protein
MIETPGWYRTNDPLRTPTFVARALGVTPQTVHRWMRKGVIQFIEVGPYRRKRIYESEIGRQRVEHVA